MTPSDIERVKDLLPTELGSAEIREQLAADILRRSVFSARMASVPYLAKVRDVCVQMLDGTLSQASARNVLEGVLDQMGHSMNDGAPRTSRPTDEPPSNVPGAPHDEPPRTVGGDVPGAPHDGGLRNPASIRRLNLIVETQTQMATSVNELMQQTPATMAAWPAWELRRVEERAIPRPDWAARWNLAGASVNWEGAKETHIGGRMVALKTSPIWQALGNGVGGFRDTLGNPYPPFAYSSGMGWVDVTAEECERLGLSGAPRTSRPTDEPRTTNPGAPHPPSLSPSDKDIADALDRYGFDFSDILA